MKVGDLVKIVQSESEKSVSPFVNETGVIVEAQLGKFSNQDSFSVMLRDGLHVFGANYLEAISEDQ